MTACDRGTVLVTCDFAAYLGSYGLNPGLFCTVSAEVGEMPEPRDVTLEAPRGMFVIDVAVGDACKVWCDGLVGELYPRLENSGDGVTFSRL